MILGKEKVFIDTNILIYANLISSPFRQKAQNKLIELYTQETILYVSNQVIREYLSALSKPDAKGQKIADKFLILDVNRIRIDFEVIFESNSSLDNLLELLKYCPTGGKQIHDANIVATMLAHNIKTLVTHNVDDFKRFEDFIEIIDI